MQILGFFFKSTSTKLRFLATYFSCWIVFTTFHMLLFINFESLIYCCCWVARLCLTLCDLVDCSMPGSSVPHCLLEFAQIHLHWVSDAIYPSHPLLAPYLSLIFLSIRVFSIELPVCIRWPKYWSFSFISSPSNEYSGLFAFRINWFNLLAVQGTHKSLLQHHNSKASILGYSACFMVQVYIIY